MQREIKEIMGKVLKLRTGALSATVWIERPLPDGIQLKAEVRGENVKEHVMVENDEEFMAFVQSYRSESPWNRMSIHLKEDGEVLIVTSFDEELEADALERTK